MIRKSPGGWTSSSSNVGIYIHLFLVSDTEAFSGTYYEAQNNVRFALMDPHLVWAFSGTYYEAQNNVRFALMDPHLV
jgi:hypothetical protein